MNNTDIIKMILSVVIGILITFCYAFNLFKRKTIILNSKRMKRLNDRVIKVDNRCFKINKTSHKCDKKE